MGKLRKTEDSSRPSVKTIFNCDPEEGFLTMKDLPALFSGHDKQSTNHLSTTSVEEKDEISLRTICPPRPLLNKLRNNAYSMSSDDSGFDDKAFDCKNTTSNPVESPKISRQVPILSRENSCSSLPPVLEPKEAMVLKKKVKWNLVARSQTRPDLYQNYNVRPRSLQVPLSPLPHSVIPQFSNILMEAMMILQEAEITGSNLSEVDE